MSLSSNAFRAAGLLRHSSVPLVFALGLLAPAAGLAQVTSTPLTTAVAGELYVYDVTAEGSGNVRITAPTGLPSWLTLESTGNGTATLSGTPTTAGTSWDLLLQVEDNVCRVFTILCARQAFVITVTAAPANNPPTVVPPGLADRSIIAGDAVEIDIGALFTDPDGDSLTFTATGLPPGLALIGSVISGVAVTTAGSPYTIVLEARDGLGGTVADEFLLTVSPAATADVAIDDIVIAPEPGLLGSEIEWQIAVDNRGPSASAGASLTLSFSGSVVDLSAEACTVAIVSGGQRLECAIGPLAVDASAVIGVSAMASQRGDIWLAATLAAPDQPSDPDTTNNRAARALSVGETLAQVPAQHLTTGAIAALASADVNGDALPDLVAATADGRILLFPGGAEPEGLAAELSSPGDRRSGPGETIELISGTGARDIELANLDDSGAPELIVAATSGTASAVYRQADDDSWQPITDLGAPTENDSAVIATDVDGDGANDIVIGGSGSVRLFLHTGDATSPALSTVTATGGDIADIVATNLLGDFLPEIVIVYRDGPVVVHENLGQGSFRAATTIEGPASSLAAADLNGDGRHDLVVGRSVPGGEQAPSNLVYIATASGGMIASGTFGLAPTSALVTGDVDRDGHIDVVSVNTTGTHQLFLGNGNGGFSLDGRLLRSPNTVDAISGPFGRRPGIDLVLAGDDGIAVFLDDGLGQLGLGDVEPPVIGLVGADSIDIEVNQSYTDPGATVSDNVDDDLAADVDNPVDPTVVGTYTVTFNAMDRAGNAAESAVRTVRVGPLAAQGSSGGGGATGWLTLLALVLMHRLRHLRKERQ